MVPETVRRKSPLPAKRLVEERAKTWGNGLLIVKIWLFDNPPPGDGFVTLTKETPPRTTADAGTVTFNCVVLTYWGVKVCPEKLTIEVVTKFVPLIVKLNAPLPVEIFKGDKDEICGTGLLTVKL